MQGVLGAGAGGVRGGRAARGGRVLGVGGCRGC